MPAERWRRIKELFQSALGVCARCARRLLRRGLQGRVFVLREVVPLIAAHEQIRNFITTPAYEIAAGVPAHDAQGAGVVLFRLMIFSGIRGVKTLICGCRERKLAFRLGLNG